MIASLPQAAPKVHHNYAQRIITHNLPKAIIVAIKEGRAGYVCEAELVAELNRYGVTTELTADTCVEGARGAVPSVFIYGVLLQLKQQNGKLGMLILKTVCDIIRKKSYKEGFI
jgi:hypothetical protein